MARRRAWLLQRQDAAGRISLQDAVSRLLLRAICASGSDTSTDIDSIAVGANVHPLALELPAMARRVLGHAMRGAAAAIVIAVIAVAIRDGGGSMITVTGDGAAASPHPQFAISGAGATAATPRQVPPASRRLGNTAVTAVLPQRAPLRRPRHQMRLLQQEL